MNQVFIHQALKFLEENKAELFITLDSGMVS